jgi:integrase
MAQGQLTAIGVQNATKVGKHHDGDGLYLQISRSRSKSWVYKYQIDGVKHEMGLGSLRKLGLKQAREKVRQLGAQRLDGIDPLEAKQAAKAARKAGKAAAVAAATLTFAQCADKCIAGLRTNWRDPKSADTWRQSLRDYVYPFFKIDKPGDLPVNLVDRKLVIQCLEAIWETRTSTARKVRGRIETVLNWAKLKELRAGENPAVWKGNLEHAFLKRHQTVHHKAMSYDDIPAFMPLLRAEDSTEARALEWLILCCARRDEGREAVWGEIKLAERLWVVPGPRMKNKKEWRVPLSDRAMAILEAVKPDTVTPDTPLFAGDAKGYLAERRMLELLQKKLIPGSELTLHGFRSTFSTWRRNETNFSPELGELALAHTVGTAVEQAYQHGDGFQRRRELSDAWARYLDGQSASVTALPLRQAAS